MVSEKAQENLTPCADQKFNKLPEGADDNDDCDFDGAIGEKSVQRIGVMQK